MNWQILIVGAIVLVALGYISFNVRRKIKSFSPKNSCGAGNCGCGEKSAGN